LGSSPYGDAGYYKDESGIVRLKGLIKSGTIGQTAFTLPIGYRPDTTLIFSVSSGGAYATLRVNSDGTVVPYTGANTYFSLDGVSFRA